MAKRGTLDARSAQDGEAHPQNQPSMVATLTPSDETKADKAAGADMQPSDRVQGHRTDSKDAGPKNTKTGNKQDQFMAKGQL